MRKKTGLSIVERAIITLPKFEIVVKKLGQQVTLRGQSNSTHQNYIRRIALFVLHFERLPEKIEEDKMKELFSPPKLLKQRIVLSLIYSAGLRGQEVINLKISDVDFERMTNHIRQGKYKKRPHPASFSYNDYWVKEIFEC